MKRDYRIVKRVRNGEEEFAVQERKARGYFLWLKATWKNETFGYAECEWHSKREAQDYYNMKVRRYLEKVNPIPLEVIETTETLRNSAGGLSISEDNKEKGQLSFVPTKEQSERLIEVERELDKMLMHYPMEWHEKQVEKHINSIPADQLQWSLTPQEYRGRTDGD